MACTSARRSRAPSERLRRVARTALLDQNAAILTLRTTNPLHPSNERDRLFAARAQRIPRTREVARCQGGVLHSITSRSHPLDCSLGFIYAPAARGCESCLCSFIRSALSMRGHAEGGDPARAGGAGEAGGDCVRRSSRSPDPCRRRHERGEAMPKKATP
jgi:hypothetical protein